VVTNVQHEEYSLHGSVAKMCPTPFDRCCHCSVFHPRLTFCNAD